MTTQRGFITAMLVVFASVLAVGIGSVLYADYVNRESAEVVRRRGDLGRRVQPEPATADDADREADRRGDARTARELRVLTIEGVDVSRYNGTVDWQAVRAADKQWAYIQIGRGVNDPDANCVQNLRDATDAGLLVGVYQRVWPQHGTAEQHALDFLACWNRVRDALPAVTLPPAVDYEESVPGGGAWCMEYADRVRAATGRAEHVIYAPGSWFEPSGHIGTQAWESDDGIYLWVADTGRWAGATPGKPRFQHPKVVAHQYSHEGTVPGVIGRCDLDLTVTSLPIGRT